MREEQGYIMFLKPGEKCHTQVITVTGSSIDIHLIVASSSQYLPTYITYLPTLPTYLHSAD